MAAPVMNLMMPPGSIVVVGPRGCLGIKGFEDGSAEVLVQNCDFIGPDGMTDSHLSMVNERWAHRAEYGHFIAEKTTVEMPTTLARALTAPTMDIEGFRRCSGPALPRHVMSKIDRRACDQVDHIRASTWGVWYILLAELVKVVLSST